jgi:hypothetical protein
MDRVLEKSSGALGWLLYQVAVIQQDPFGLSLSKPGSPSTGSGQAFRQAQGERFLALNAKPYETIQVPKD